MVIRSQKMPNFCSIKDNQVVKVLIPASNFLKWVTWFFFSQQMPKLYFALFVLVNKVGKSTKHRLLRFFKYNVLIKVNGKYRKVKYLTQRWWCAQKLTKLSLRYCSIAKYVVYRGIISCDHAYTFRCCVVSVKVQYFGDQHEGKQNDRKRITFWWYFKPHFDLNTSFVLWFNPSRSICFQKPFACLSKI